MAVALRELGRIERTLFALDWMQNVELRRRVQIGLNKGEAKNAFARAVFLNRLGELRDRSFENQRYRASGLNLVVAAIVLWNTVYLERAVQALRDSGKDVDDTLLPHLSPLGWAICIGRYNVFPVHLGESHGFDAQTLRELTEAVEQNTAIIEGAWNEHSAKSVRFDDYSMWVELSDGRTLGIPLAWFPRLMHANP